MIFSCRFFPSVSSMWEKMYAQEKNGMSYQEKHSFEYRHAEARKIMTKYPERVPIVCERHTRCTSIPSMDKHKFLVPADITMGQFLYIIRRRIQIEANASIFLFTACGCIPPICTPVSTIYTTYKAEDGFLYLLYSSENAFG